MCYRWGAVQRPYWWILVLVIATTLVACSLYYARIHRFWGITQTDFSVFYDAGWRLARHESPYPYRATRFTTDPEYRFKYAPPFAMAMMPLAALPVQTAIRWWYALSALAFLAAMGGVRFLLARDAALPSLPGWAWGLLFLTVLRPYLSTLRLGQVDVMLAALLIGFLAALSCGRQWLAGACLGIALLCKLSPAIWLFYLIAARAWRAILWTAVAILLLLASPIPHVGLGHTGQLMNDWWQVLQTASGNWEWLVRAKNQSLLSFILRVATGGDPAAMTPLLLNAAVGVTAALGVLFLAGIRRLMRGDLAASPSPAALAAPALTMIAMVLFSPHAWKATFIHLLLPYAVLIAHLTSDGRRDRMGWGCLVGSFALVSATAPNVVLGRPLAHGVNMLGPLTWGALLLAFALWRIRRPVT